MTLLLLTGLFCLSDNYLVPHLDGNAVGMVGLAALSAGDDASLHVLSEGSAHDAHVLLQHKLVLGGAQHHLVVVVGVGLEEGAAGRAGAARVLRSLREGLRHEVTMI